MQDRGGAREYILFRILARAGTNFTKPSIHHLRTLGTVRELSCVEGGFSLCLVQDGERVGPPHCTHNLERERGSSSSLLPLSLPVCLGCTPRPQAPPSTLVCSTLSTLALPSIPNRRRRRRKSPILASDQEFVQSISKNCRLAGYLRTSLEGGNESQVAC